ncbi:MAG: pH regulation protein F, partial [Candidatus Eisenbacteria bacterium]|nr:pH regulation protein F [Candidatus Eisenbacteria bacterium]
MFLGLAIFIALLIAVNFYRVLVGPTIFDRLLAVGLVGSNALLLIVLIGFLYERADMFLDLALTYAILNFIGVLALG